MAEGNYSQTIFLLTAFLVCVIGFFINIVMAKFIVNEYCMDVTKNIKTANYSVPDRVLLCKIGKNSSGYCKSCLKYLEVFLYFFYSGGAGYNFYRETQFNI